MPTTIAYALMPTCYTTKSLCAHANVLNYQSLCAHANALQYQSLCTHACMCAVLSHREPLEWAEHSRLEISRGCHNSVYCCHERLTPSPDTFFNSSAGTYLAAMLLFVFPSRHFLQTRQLTSKCTAKRFCHDGCVWHGQEECSFSSVSIYSVTETWQNTITG